MEFGLKEKWYERGALNVSLYEQDIIQIIWLQRTNIFSLFATSGIKKRGVIRKGRMSKACTVPLTTLERDDEPRDRWSPNTASPGLLMLHTLTCAHAHTGTEQPLSYASKSPDGPSATLLCPAWCRASGTHWSQAQFSTHFLAGGRCDSPACWRSNANRHLLLLLSSHVPYEKGPSVCVLGGSWGKACIEPANAPEASEMLWRTPLSRFGVGESPVGLVFHWQRPLLCHNIEDCCWNVQQKSVMKRAQHRMEFQTALYRKMSQPDKAEPNSSNHMPQLLFLLEVSARGGLQPRLRRSACTWLRACS